MKRMQTSRDSSEEHRIENLVSLIVPRDHPAQAINNNRLLTALQKLNESRLIAVASSGASKRMK